MLAGDANDFVEKLTANINAVLESVKRRATDEIENDIAEGQKEILVLSKKFDRKTNDYARGERLGREIDSLRQELLVARKIEDEKALMEYRIKLFGDIINEPLQTFDPATFQASVDKVVIQRQETTTEGTQTKLCFVFKSGVEMSETI